MKKLLRTICIMLLALGVSATPVLANSSSDIQVEGQATMYKASGVKLNKKKATIYVGKTVKLKLTGTSKKVTWTSSNRNVAKVSKNGKVKGISVGKATVTAKVGKTKYTCKITVKKSVIAVSGVSLSQTNLSLYVGDTSKLMANVYPSNATNKSVIWSSSDTSVATVSSGTVKAVGVGTATIYATTKDGDYTASCSVSVTQSTGTVSGNITYHYNKYRGYVANTNSVVLLIPADGSAATMPQLSSYVSWLSSASINRAGNEYGVYAGTVDGNGDYTINNVPVGDYVAFIISYQTTSPYGFTYSLEESYTLIQGYLESYIGSMNARDIGEAVGYKAWNMFTNVNVAANDTTTLSYAFGYTYI